MPKHKPIFSWVGSKTGLTGQIVPQLPLECRNYYEPFLGCGAVFFSYIDRAEFAVLSDINPHVVNVFHALREYPDSVKGFLRKHSYNHSYDYYCKVRDHYHEDEWRNFESRKAADFMYLMKRAYAYIYREDDKGRLAMSPSTADRRPRIYDPQTLNRASKQLQKSTAIVKPYSDIYPAEGDTVYCDPPYRSTIQYTRKGFRWKDQIDLKRWCDECVKRGAFVAVSHNDDKDIAELYNDYERIPLRPNRRTNLLSSENLSPTATKEVLYCAGTRR